jgi:hypothetical protein
LPKDRDHISNNYYHHHRSHTTKKKQADKIHSNDIDLAHKSTKKATITFSIDDFVIAEIKRESENIGVSINAKVNQILAKWVMFYRMAEKYRAVVIQPSVFADTIEHTDENVFIDNFKRSNRDTIQAWLLQSKLPVTLESVIKHLFEIYGPACGIYNDFSYHTTEEGHIRLIFHHEFGIKWSRILAAAFSDLISELLSLHCKSDLLTNTVVLEVIERNAA